MFDNVSFSYNTGKVIFDNLSVKFNKGDYVAVTGPSGVGKSTFINLLLQRIVPVSGNIYINGNPANIWKNSDYIGHISVLPQKIFLFSANIEDNILFGRDSEEDTLSYIKDFCQIKDFSDNNIKELSGGEQQRIGIARALLKQTDVLILDEPTSALDHITQEKIIKNLMQYLHEKNVILFIITHRKELLEICNKHLLYNADDKWELI